MTRAASLYVTVACLALSEQCDSVEALHHNDRLLVVQRTLQRGGACRRSKQRPSLVQVAAPLAEDCDVAVRALFKHNRGYSSARRSRFGATSGRRISDSVNALLKSPTSVVLLRGGAAATMDATSMATSLNRILKVLLTRSTVAKYIACYWMVQGLRSGINSVRFWERNGSLKLRSEDLAAWAGEVIGLVTFSKALLVMSVLFSTLNPMDATALCTLPCFIFWWREWSTGALDKFGFIAAFGPILILYSIIANVATFSRLVPSDVIQTYVYVLPLLVLGVAGWLFPESTADDVGIALIKPSDTVLWVFVGRSLLSLTALLATLFKAGNTSAAMTNAIRNSTLVTGITTLLDILWFRRKTFKDANFSSDKAIRFTIQTLFWAALMFLLPGPL